jgi:hypothetical protein
MEEERTTNGGDAGTRRVEQILLSAVLELAKDLPDTTLFAFVWHHEEGHTLIPVWRLLTRSGIIRFYEAPSFEKDEAQPTLGDLRRLAAPGDATLRCALTDDRGLWVDQEVNSIHLYYPGEDDLPYTATLLAIGPDDNPWY